MVQVHRGKPKPKPKPKLSLRYSVPQYSTIVGPVALRGGRRFLVPQYEAPAPKGHRAGRSRKTSPEPNQPQPQRQPQS